MTSNRYLQVSGLFLCLSAFCFLADTTLDAYLPAISPGIGAFVAVCGLAGFPGFWSSLGPRMHQPLGLAAYFLVMLGLAGLVVVMFLFNRVTPDLTPEETGRLLTVIAPELTAIVLVFAVSALVLAAALWPMQAALRYSGLAYAAGAVLVAATPALPEWLTVVAALLVSGALLAWGVRLLPRDAVPAVAI